MAHANARLTPAGRLTLVGRIATQPRRPIAHIAHEMGISRTTAYRWWARYQQLGEAGLVDRLLHHAHLVLTKGDSHRLAEALAGKGVVPLT